MLNLIRMIIVRSSATAIGRELKQLDIRTNPRTRLDYVGELMGENKMGENKVASKQTKMGENKVASKLRHFHSLHNYVIVIFAGRKKILVMNMNVVTISIILFLSLKRPLCW
jgi:hypothetical protein